MEALLSRSRPCYSWLHRLLVLAVSFTVLQSVGAQDLRFGGRVPPEVETIYENGIAWLAENQKPDGSWSGGNQGAGATGLGVMALLSSGEDPNFGRYAPNIRRGLRNIIAQQDGKTGYIPSTMYHHGFAMLTLAEAYGAVDDTLLWQSAEKENSEGDATGRTIAEALQLAIRGAVTSQKKNPQGGWRYSPDDAGADTSVVGSVMIGLLAARNAGMDVPDEALDTGHEYMRRNTGSNGYVAYYNFGGAGGESMARSSVATLVSAIGKQKDTDEYKATLEHISSRLEAKESGHPYYFLYYMAQALFQGDYESWEKWNAATIRKLESQQLDNGSYGNDAYRTSMSLLSLALNYRFLPIYER